MKSLLIALTLVLGLAPLSAHAGPRVRVEAGTLEGVQLGGVRAFKSIPYAAPPVGELRWRAPQPALSWRGVRDATAFRASCMQTLLPNGTGPWTPEFFPQTGLVSEDCLTLSVWTPATRRGERLPVLLWVPGGGFRNGGEAVAVNDGAALAREGVVVVSINYRLGAFGFLAHPDLEAEADGGASNYGARDVIAALAWVRDNIAAFGGDPERVTLAGQSAGGAQVAVMMASPLAQGLFQRAIIQSSPPGGGRYADRAAAEAMSARFSEALSAATLEDLRAAPAEAVLTASDALQFRPFVDGVLLAHDPAQGVAASSVPLMTGLTAQEFAPQPNLANWRAQIASRYGASAEALLALYPAATDAESVEAALDSERERTLAGLTRLATAREAPTYLYVWTHALPGPDAARLRAFHSSEMPFMFGALGGAGRVYTDADRAISETMLSYWSNFVKAGDPNGEGLAPWPRAEASPPPIMALGDAWAPIEPLTPEKRALFDEHFSESGAFAF